MRVFVYAVHGSVCEAAVKGEFGSSIGPEQSDKIDAVDATMMLAAPVLMNQFDMPSMGLVEGAVVKDQKTRIGLNKRFRFVPQRLGIGRLSLKQAGISVMGRRKIRRTIRFRRFDTGKGGLRRQQKLDVV